MAKTNDNGKAKHEENGGTVTVVLKIDLHCEGCAAKFVKATLSIAGVESVKRLENDNLKEIAVIGKVDPDELRQKVEKKIKRKVELISPVTKNQKDGDGKQKKQQKQQTAAVKDDNKQVKFPVTTTVLKVSLHCQGCIEKIKKLVRKTEGFMEMSIDKNNDLVTVKGGMDVNKLITTLKDKLKRKVETVQAKDSSGGKKAKDSSGGKKAKGGDGGGDKDRKESSGGGQKVEENFLYQGQYTYPQYTYPYYANGPDYTYNYLPAPQMFNDENPNACLVM